MVAEDRVVVFDETTRWNIADFEYTNKNKLKNDLPAKWKSTPEEFIKLVRFDSSTQKCYLNEAGNVAVMDDETKVEPPGEIPLRPMEDEDYVKAVKTTLAYLVNNNVIKPVDKDAWEVELNMNSDVLVTNFWLDVEKVRTNNAAYEAQGVAQDDQDDQGSPGVPPSDDDSDDSDD